MNQSKIFGKYHRTLTAEFKSLATMQPKYVNENINQKNCYSKMNHKCIHL